jgi:hypothetical protein
LNNGNYVVRSPKWNDNRGAVTWGNGTVGVTGVVGATNSLIGTNANDYVGNGGMTVLTNANYVVKSLSWNDNRGAATWARGTVASTGVISASNSLVGSNPNDSVGWFITPLTNGNYVVGSFNWNDNRGAATWGNGTVGVTGDVSASNSLVGSTPNDAVSFYGIGVLSNGNYLVTSPNWDVNRGAVTWGNGTEGITGVVSVTNSLIGSNSNDSVGSGGIAALTNGNYVVNSPGWNGKRGAVTWGNGTVGITGAISEGNSLVGSNPNDSVGYPGVGTLSNGNYVVSSFNWNGNRGASTWGSGTVGITGAVSAANSLVGINPNDQVGSGNMSLGDGNYLVISPSWGGSRGATTWVSGTSGQTLDSSNTITPQNSLLGLATFVVALRPVENPIHKAFVVTFLPFENGRITTGFVDTNQFTYARGRAQTLTITPALLTRTLKTGTAVILQATNDITVEDAILVSAGGQGGGLTLQAGRSIVVNVSIRTDNGPLTLIANDTLANGVIDSQRDVGNAFITMAGGTVLDTGTAPLSIELRDGAGRTYTSSRAINLQAIVAGSLSVLNNGPSPGSDIRLDTVTTSGPQSYRTPQGSTTVAGNLTAADQSITFMDSVVVNDGVTLDAGSDAIQFAGNGTQTLQSGSGVRFSNLSHTGSGTLQLTGDLNITGTFSSTAGTIDASIPSMVMISEALTFTAATTLSVALNDLDPGTGYTQITAGGPIDLGGCTLSLSLGFTPEVGDRFTLLTSRDGSPIRGTFAGLDEGSTFTQDGITFQITYQGGPDGNSVVLTRV